MAENLQTAYQEAQTAINEVGEVNAVLGNFLQILYDKIQELPQEKALEIKAVLEMIVNSGAALKAAAKT